MRLAFMGSPEFALPALRSLHDAGHEVVVVYCQPARPAGRGHAVQACPVQRVAERLGLPVRTPVRLRGNVEEAAQFAALDLDAAVVAAYGLILPPTMLSAPRRGCLNIHASLLPRWRGAAPIQAAILAGDSETGISIMRMEAGLDTGPVLLRQAIPIGPHATAAVLHDQLAGLGARLILDALATESPGTPQASEDATYAPRLTRADGRLDWRLAATINERRVRALNPWPGTWTMHGETTMKVLQAETVPVSTPLGLVPGTVIDDRLTVACGRDALRLLRIQRPGRSPLAATDFLRGQSVPPGTVLGP
jgi:methionyl-tRNA formyltransferase